MYSIRIEGTEGRLVREFRKVPQRGDRVTSAVSALGLPPADPDYTTFWRRPSRLSVDVRSDRIVVDLSPDAFADTNIGSGPMTAVAIQQLVWTATAAAGRNLPVVVLVDGKPDYEAWGGYRLDEPLSREPVHRAPVWIDAPVQGGVLKPVRPAVVGQGAGFEATFHYTVTSGSRRVASGSVTGTPEGHSYGWWTFRIPLDLGKGTYTVAVTADNPATGAEAGPAWTDTKLFTVP